MSFDEPEEISAEDALIVPGYIIDPRLD